MNLKFPITLILSASLYSCQKKEQQTNAEIIQIDTNLFVFDEDTILATQSYNRISDSLFIYTAIDTLLFVSKPYEEERSCEFKKLDFNEKNQFHIVQATYWEWQETYLISHQTSKIDTIWEEPVFSENGQFLLSKSMDYGLEGNPNGFQLWKLQEQKWIKIYEVDQQGWIPVSLKWITNDRFIVLITTTDKLESVNFDHSKLTQLNTLQYSTDAAVPHSGGK